MKTVIIFFKGALILLFAGVFSCEKQGNTQNPESSEVITTNAKIVASTPNRITADIAATAIYTMWRDNLCPISNSYSTKMKSYIISKMEAAGYTTTLQSIKTGSTIGVNLVFNNKNTATIAKKMIITGHYDQTINAGADDNCSGVALIIKLAQDIRLANKQYDVVFVFPDLEEIGLYGSKAYVKSLTAVQKNDIILNIDINSIAVGDYLYADSGPLTAPGVGSNSWGRTGIINFSEANNLDIRMNPGLNKNYPVGTCAFQSDHVPFYQAGIPVVSIEGTNWSIGQKDGNIQTLAKGSYWDMPNKDTFAIVERDFPGRALAHFKTLYQALYFATTSMKK